MNVYFTYGHAIFSDSVCKPVRTTELQHDVITKFGVLVVLRHVTLGGAYWLGSLRTNQKCRDSNPSVSLYQRIRGWTMLYCEQFWPFKMVAWLVHVLYMLFWADLQYICEHNYSDKGPDQCCTQLILSQFNSFGKHFNSIQFMYLEIMHTIGINVSETTSITS